MKTFLRTIATGFVVVAFIHVLIPTVHAEQKKVDVSGFTFPIGSGPTEGRHAGPNFVAERALFSLIFPCTVPFCGFDASGFLAADPTTGQIVVTDPERVVRIDRQGNRFYRMVARQTITGSIIADGVLYEDCVIEQTVIATGNLRTDVPIEEATATNVEGTWVITGGSTCEGGTVNVTGRGTLEWLGNPTMPPTYEGTIHISQD